LIPAIYDTIPPSKGETPYIQGKITVPPRGLARKSIPMAIIRTPRYQKSPGVSKRSVTPGHGKGSGN